MAEPKSDRHALVLSGGGANGAYEVGVIKALLNGDSSVSSHVPVIPDIFTGTSIGAFNAALLLSLMANAARGAPGQLEDVWLNVIPRYDNTGHNSVLRFRSDPADYLNPRYFLTHPIEYYSQFLGDLSFFALDSYRRALYFFLSDGSLQARLLKLLDLSSLISNSPELRLVNETINFANIRASDKPLKVTATNWRTGELKLFNNQDFTDEIGPRVIEASAALPGIFPQVEIEGEYFADGGVVMNTPLKPAIDAGADVLHVIYLNPDVENIPLLPVRNTIDTISRTFVMQFAASVNQDIEVARAINNGIDLLEKGGAGLRSPDERPRRFMVSGSVPAALVDPSFHRRLTIHRYQPHDVLGGILGMLDFSRDRIAELIERGVNDGARHDCDHNKCVLPNVAA